MTRTFWEECVLRLCDANELTTADMIEAADALEAARLERFAIVWPPVPYVLEGAAELPRAAPLRPPPTESGPGVYPEAERAADFFNASYPVGTPVEFQSTGSPTAHVGKTTGPAIVNDFGDACVPVMWRGGRCLPILRIVKVLPS